MSENTHHLRSLSLWMRGACVVAIVITAVAMGVLFVEAFADRMQFLDRFGADIRGRASVGMLQTLAVLAIGLVPAILTIAAFAALSRFFAAMSVGNYFSVATVSHLRRAGALFVISAICSVVAQTLSVLIVTVSNAPGARQLSIGLDSGTMLLIFLAGVLFAVGHAFSVAAAIDDENRSIV